MTHESFKDICDYCEFISRDELDSFCDGEDTENNILLLEWFDIWKTGHFRNIHDEIKQLNQIYMELRRNEDNFSIPTDANLKREKNNGNKEKTRKIRILKGVRNHVS